MASAAADEVVTAVAKGDRVAVADADLARASSWMWKDVKPLRKTIPMRAITLRLPRGVLRKFNIKEDRSPAQKRALSVSELFFIAFAVALREPSVDWWSLSCRCQNRECSLRLWLDLRLG